MPRIVDHDERRREVALIAIRLIVESGLEALTIRDIARAAGYSTSVVSHYFHNKRDLLLFAYRMLMMQAVARVEALLEAGADLQTCLEALLPLDEERRRSWQVWFAFWGMAATDMEFRLEQQQSGREARKLIERVLSHEIKSSHLSPADVEWQARRLLVSIAGLATQSTYDPEDWSPVRQKAVLADEIAAVTVTVRERRDVHAA